MSIGKARQPYQCCLQLYAAVNRNPLPVRRLEQSPPALWKQAPCPLLSSGPDWPPAPPPRHPLFGCRVRTIPSPVAPTTSANPFPLPSVSHGRRGSSQLPTRIRPSSKPTEGVVEAALDSDHIEDDPSSIEP
ncbi:Protein of unknown function [Gryllus bimaculatus]|nr:Protein of unknown function [Gryllus bimaculatus]